LATEKQSKIGSKAKRNLGKAEKVILFRNEIKNVSQAAQIISSCFFNKEKRFR
jgi:hypothetical protein